MLTRDVEWHVATHLGACVGREYAEVEVVQTLSAVFANPNIAKVLVNQVQLRDRAQAKYGARVSGKANGGCPAVIAVTKLNNAVTAAVTGLRIHAVALHQREAREIIR